MNHPAVDVEMVSVTCMYVPSTLLTCARSVGLLLVRKGMDNQFYVLSVSQNLECPPRLVVAYPSTISLDTDSDDVSDSESIHRTDRARSAGGKARKATTTILNRKKVVRCMLVQEELSGIKGLMAAAVKKFHAMSMLARGTQISLKLHSGGSRKKTFYTEEEGHRRFRLVGTRGANT
ncbi:hypothetical protein JG688_00008086 [Phytophthora aleatoria]|uniref:Uncharacterized protein n=1 Tax=Phytophthora aleatoria TaxID=2496075 RepID=A0A8J5J557_9STRA|nr:hypothetical protein JG688_00008086 [Phytophthora aleatoria]